MTSRVAIVFPAACLESTPHLRNLVQRLADRGWEADVYTSEEEQSPKPEFSGAVRLELYRGSTKKFIPWLWRSLRPRLSTYDAIVAMDRLGIIAAAAVTLGARKPVPIFHNTEVYIPPIFTGWKNRLANRAEGFLANRYARLTLCPSMERGRVLNEMYGLPMDRIRAVPNSPLGRAQWRKTDYLTRKYDIESGRPIILYIGSLTSANRIEELFRSARENWPEDFVFVCHGRYRSSEAGREWFRSHTEGARCRIIHSAEPLSSEELARMVGGADVGVALYPTDGASFASLGTASGKVAQYLFSGVPTVMTSIPSLEAMFEEFPTACRVVETADEIPGAARPLLDSGEAGRRAAADCFERYFSFDRPFDEFHELLAGWVGGPAPASADATAERRGEGAA